MSIPLPNLDDRRWVDLVEESLAIVPVQGPEWTDHNIHDPGRMLIELFAWITEMDIYWLNRVPDEHRRKFLELIGIRALPPRPARTFLQLELQDSASSLPLPSGVEFIGLNVSEQLVPFRTLTPVTVVPGKIEALQTEVNNGFHDLTAAHPNGPEMRPFGDEPVVGAAFYIGFSQSLPTNMPITLYLQIDQPYASLARRQAIIEELVQTQRLCRTPHSLTTCASQAVLKTSGELQDDGIEGPLTHQSIRLEWSFWTSDGGWTPLAPDQGEVVDDTRSITENGRLQFIFPEPLNLIQVGEVEQPLYYIRCRLIEGQYDKRPAISAAALNGVAVEQATSPARFQWTVAQGAAVSGATPTAGDDVRFRIKLNRQGEITHLQWLEEDAPALGLLEYVPPMQHAAGYLRLCAEKPGVGNGRANQQVLLSTPVPVEDSLRIITSEPQNNSGLAAWTIWERRFDFDASTPADAHYLIDLMTGALQFGDGNRGRSLPDGAICLAVYDSTLARNGSLDIARIAKLAGSEKNQLLLTDIGCDVAAKRIAKVTNPTAAVGGSDGESLNELFGRAFASIQQQERAVTLSDIEAIALETPGTCLARAVANANQHPAFPCYKASGVITLVIIPYLPSAQPLPTPGTRRLVAQYLQQQRVIGTRIEVVGPRYVDVHVRAEVRACPGIDNDALLQRVEEKIERFLHPLEGGPSGDGWPLGRDIYRSEIVQLIDEIPGVDYVVDLALFKGDDKASCGNLCIESFELPASGQHGFRVYEAREQ